MNEYPQPAKERHAHQNMLMLLTIITEGLLCQDAANGILVIGGFGGKLDCLGKKLPLQAPTPPPPPPALVDEILVWSYFQTHGIYSLLVWPHNWRKVQLGHCR